VSGSEVGVSSFEVRVMSLRVEVPCSEVEW